MLDAPGVDPSASPCTLPAPTPPDAPDAWYAPAVHRQTELAPDVVATIQDDAHGLRYDVREPKLSSGERTALDRVSDHFADAKLTRPVTREGATERIDAGFEAKYRDVFDSLLDVGHGPRRRIEYWVLRDLRALGSLTPLALDDEIGVIDPDGDTLIVHTDSFAPLATTVPSDHEHVDRFASERVTTHSVPFCGYDIPVIVHCEHVLGGDHFTEQYAVREPDCLPGDAALIEECKDRIWETTVDGVIDDRAEFVRERARELLVRRLAARSARTWLEATAYRVRSALATYGLVVPPVGRRFSRERLDDLVYYVLRDFVGEGKLTIPIRDPNLEDIEANRVGERIKVVPRSATGSAKRMPSNLAFENETEFVNVVTQLAAADGTELNASTPTAKVNLDPAGLAGTNTAATIRCALALSVVSDGGPHVSIRKQSPDPMTPVDLVNAGSVTTEIVTLLWMLYEHHGVVLFSGSTGVGKTTLMNAHMPFIPFDDRPISIDEGSREVTVPHETGVALTTRDHEQSYKRVSMADLMTECNYLNPDVEVIAEINSPASFRTFGETLNTGHGLIGTTHAESIEKLINRVVEQGLPAYLVSELDLVVFPKRVDGDRYVGEVVELVTETEFRDLDGGGIIEKDGTTVHWNRVAWRDPDGDTHFAFDHPALGDDDHRLEHRVFHRIADWIDRPVDAVETEFVKKHRYVEYLVRDDVSDFEALFGLLADLETHESATIERLATRP